MCSEKGRILLLILASGIVVKEYYFEITNKSFRSFFDILLNS